MAMIDYGAVLKVNGKIINNKMFMDESNLGYKLKQAESWKGPVDIDGNYFVYAGDEKLLLVFYKTYGSIIENKKITHSILPRFKSETIYTPHSNITISHLDDTEYVDNWYLDEVKETWEEYVCNYICAYEEDAKNYNHKGRRYKWFLRYKKGLARMRKNPPKLRTSRYIASWTYNGDSYEVLFGYGIDVDLSVMENLAAQNLYGFHDNEIRLIKEWFTKRDGHYLNEF